MSNNNSSGLGFCKVLALIFISFKLLNIITWSWVWVLAPIWIPIVIFIMCVIIAIVVTLME